RISPHSPTIVGPICRRHRCRVGALTEASPNHGALDVAANDRGQPSDGDRRHGRPKDISDMEGRAHGVGGAAHTPSTHQEGKGPGMRVMFISHSSANDGFGGGELTLLNLI